MDLTCERFAVDHQHGHSIDHFAGYILMEMPYVKSVGPPKEQS